MTDYATPTGDEQRAESDLEITDPKDQSVDDAGTRPEPGLSQKRHIEVDEEEEQDEGQRQAS